MHPRLTSSLIASLLCVALTGCNQNKAIIPIIPQKQTLSAALDVKVTQPDIKKLLAVTGKLQLVATGKFAAGSYWVGSHNISFAPDTEFRIDLQLPVTNPEVISTRNATGSLWTSKQFSVDAIPVPQTIQLGEGKVSGEVDFGRFLGAFLFNILQFGNNHGGLRNVLAHMKVENARLELRPGAELKFGLKTLHVAKESTITMSDLVVDHDLNYSGNMLVNLHFEPGCKWLGRKTDCRFNGGNARINLAIKHVGKALTLELDQGKQKKTSNEDNSNSRDQKHEITLKECSFDFGKLKRSNSISDTCNIDLSQLKWTRFSDTREPVLELTSKMFLIGTKADIKTDIHETVGIFPGTVPALLVVQPLGDNHETHFATTANAIAQSIVVTLAKKASKLSLSLEKSTVGPLSFDKQGDLNFSLQKGTAKFKRVEWTNKDSSFSLCGSDASNLTVPSEMWLEKATNQKTKMTLPINLTVGKGQLYLGGSDIELEGLNGRLLFEVDEEVQLKSDLDFSIKKSPFFKDFQADVKARGLDLSVVKGASTLSLKNCQLLLPDQALEEAIARESPTEYSFDINKTLVEDKHWRYRNATAKKVKLTNLHIEKMKPTTGGEMEFVASADVDMQGTVEKCGLIIAKNKWETKPWQLSGHLTGPGKVKYKFYGSKSEPTKVQYNLEMQLPLPKDLKLDWSQVGAGLLKATERQIILSHLKELTVPVKHQGDLTIFGETKWSKIKINDLIARPAAGGSQIEFSADARL